MAWRRDGVLVLAVWALLAAMGSRASVGEEYAGLAPPMQAVLTWFDGLGFADVKGVPLRSGGHGGDEYTP